MGKLDGKIALITGGTSGIGEASAKLFAEEGATVIVVGRNKNKGAEIEKEIQKYNPKSFYFECDITSNNQIGDLRKKIEEVFGRLDILFNNAGILETGALEDLTYEKWNSVYEINTTAQVMMCKNFMELLIKSHGVILNNASIDGLQYNARGRAYMYATSKAALIQFTQVLALNYSDTVRVNCICPGTTKTNLFTNKDYSRFIDKIPMKRVAESIEIAKVALFLVSDDASYITGANIVVDGGSSLL